MASGLIPAVEKKAIAAGQPAARAAAAQPRGGILTAAQVYQLARQAGATPEEAVLLTAIANQESGYNSGARYTPGTGEDSYGLWQINMNPSYAAGRRSTFGISDNSQLFDPVTNAKAALSILRSQGFGAWSTYSSGAYQKSLNEAQQAAASTGDKIDQSKLSIAAAKVGQTLGATGPAFGPNGQLNTNVALPADATPAQVEEYVRAKFPEAAGFLDVPEVRDLLIKAAQQNYDDNQLQAELEATTWWKTTGASVRQYYATKNVDPAAHEELIQQKIAELAPQIAQLGLSMDVRVYAENALKYGWTPAQLAADEATRLRMQSSATGLKPGSAPAASADNLATIATSEYYVPLTRQDAEKWAINIQEGRSTEAQFRDYLEGMSEGRFPGLKGQGMTPGQYMAPIVNTIASTLEINPGDVNLLDPRYSEVLQAHQADGKYAPMTISQAQQWARSQPGYLYTNGARDTAAQFGDLLTKTFGKTA